jgi:membrane-associated phospholipid phosphatase
VEVMRTPFWIAGAGVLVLLRRRNAFPHVGFLQLGCAGLSPAFKGLFQRQRPPFSHGMHLDSFPSGRVLAAVTRAGGLLVLLIPTLKRRGARIAACTAAALWLLLMALSRVYLGRHYPVDTLGSLMLGVAWICFAESMVQRVNAAPASQLAEAPK